MIPALLAIITYALTTASLSAVMTRHIMRSIVWPTTYDNLKDRRHWKAGDMLIFASAKGNALAINLFSGVPWTHVGLLVSVGQQWFLWHASPNGDRYDATDCRASRWHDGVQLTPLDYYLETESSVARHVPAPPGVVVPPQTELLAQVRRECARGRRYGFDSDIPRLISVGLSPDPKQTWLGGRDLPPPKSFFCSAFVAEMYRRWGWDLDGAPSVLCFHPKHFLKYIQ